MSSGIYKIVCLFTGKFYVGSAKNLNRRFKRHRSELRKGIHSNPYLQKAWNKYGEENFKFEIIEEVDQELLLCTEQKWLDDTKCYERNIGFNILKNAEHPGGRKPSKTTLKKISNKNSKTWIVKNPKGKSFLVKHLVQFCKNNNLIHSLMIAVANCKRRQHKGWHCRHTNMPLEKWQEQQLINYSKINKNSKKHLIINPDGIESIVESLNKFCELNNLSYPQMKHVANGIQRHHKGWKCRIDGMSENELQLILNKNLIKKSKNDKEYYKKIKNPCT